MPGIARTAAFGADNNVQVDVQLRDATLFPFSSDSPFNTAIGSGAVFGDTSDPQYQSVTLGSATLNTASWTVSVAMASYTDPLVTVTSTKDTVYAQSTTGTPTAQSFVTLSSLYIPANPDIEALNYTASDYASTPYDTWTCIIQPNGHTVQEITGKVSQQSSTQWSAGHASISDVYSDGLNQGRRASNTSNLAGLIRKADLLQGTIAHAVALSLGSNQLGDPNGTTTYANQFQWPAFAADQPVNYTGNVRMGTLFAIPGTTSVTNLGLSGAGLLLAHALQDYGTYVIARGSDSHQTIYAEYELSSTDRNSITSAWSTLCPLLRRVINNSSTSVGGGGSPRQPSLPPVQ